MKTFKEIQDDIWRQLKENSSSPNFWSVDEVKTAANDAVVIIADESYCFRLEAIIQIVAGIRVYKLPYNYVFGSLDRVEFDSEIIHPMSSSELDDYSISWKSKSGSEVQAYIPPGDICGFDEIAVYPLPDTNGTVYNTATNSGDLVGFDTLVEFTQEEGTLVSTDEDDVRFDRHSGAVVQIQSESGNLKVYGARYPKPRYSNNEAFSHPISYNPRKIITNGALAILFSKEGEGKDIAKASYYNKRFMEMIDKLKKPSVKRRHRIRSISEYGGAQNRLNLGSHYPYYPR